MIFGWVRDRTELQSLILSVLVACASVVCHHEEPRTTLSPQTENSTLDQVGWLSGIADENSDQGLLNLTHLIYVRFQKLFEEPEENLNLSKKEVIEGNETLALMIDDFIRQQQSTLETRKVDQSHSYHPNTYSQNIAGAHSNQLADELAKKDFFKILNRVFSRIELPEVFKSPKLRSTSTSSSGYCAQHIGCVEAIPNFPSLLKKTNVSSSFTIYSRGSIKLGHKIQYEPLLHFQLQDAPIDNSSLATQTTPDGSNRWQTYQKGIGGKRRTANSWRTASKIVKSQEYPFDLSSLEQSGFNSSLNTRIIVGGYFAKEDEEWIDEVVRQWLLLEPCNIIKVSWADANRGLYHSAAYNSRIVGRQLSLFLHYLDQLFNIDLNKFHLVGHSLGAHIAGFVGADSEGRIARITGLDPAGPIFVELNASLRLDPSDAKFVDVVHTNGGTITKGALGLSTPSGHVDYYCNGGSVQPGCYFSSVTKSIMDPVERVACNHRRSYRYFIEITKLAISEAADPTSSPQSETLSSTITGGSFEDGADLARSALGQSSQTRAKSSSMPRAFLFEAKNEELVKLSQPEILLASNKLSRRELQAELAPLKRQLEFHLLNPEFPLGKRGMYFFRTRPESPFFG